MTNSADSLKGILLERQMFLVRATFFPQDVRWTFFVRLWILPIIETALGYFN